MRDWGPVFHAACATGRRLDAFEQCLAATSAESYHVGIRRLGAEDLDLYPCSKPEVIRAVRAAWGTGMTAEVSYGARLTHWHVVRFSMRVADPEYERRLQVYVEPLSAEVSAARGDTSEPDQPIELPLGERSVMAEAAAVALPAMADQEEHARALTASSHVTTFGATMLWDWGSPAEMSASYHLDGLVVRDLAVTWVHVHDGDRTRLAAEHSLEALRARIESAPAGARVGIAKELAHVDEHQELDGALLRSGETRPKRRDVVRTGCRARLPTDAELTREEVLAALAVPSATMVDALDACAVPDDEWRAAAPLALSMMEALREGAPTEAVKVTRRRHLRWIEQHAPYQVRRLPNGGVMLATHPYRILWPLWADALALLGIREAS